jgi:hypothetical protein
MNNKNKKTIDLTKITDIEFEGIDHRDYPDYCNAYISKAWIEIDGPEYILLPADLTTQNNHKFYRQLTENELEYIQDNHGEWVYEKLWN